MIKLTDGTKEIELTKRQIEVIHDGLRELAGSYGWDNWELKTRADCPRLVELDDLRTLLEKF
jgi:hypothetical protein